MKLLSKLERNLQKMFKNILIGFFVCTTAYFVWISLTIQADPIERAFDRYNHVRLYEDGSYVGEDRQGVKVQGCVKNGLCQD